MKCREIKSYLDNLSGVDISKSSRKILYIKFRSIYYFLAYKYATDGLSYESVGSLLNKDHASVINGLKTFESFYLTDEPFKKLFTIAENHVVKNASKRQVLEINRIESLDKEPLKSRLINAHLKLSKHYKTINRLKKSIEELKKSA